MGGELWPSWRGGIIITAAQPSMWGEEGGGGGCVCGYGYNLTLMYPNMTEAYLFLLFLYIIGISGGFWDSPKKMARQFSRASQSFKRIVHCFFKHILHCLNNNIIQ